MGFLFSRELITIGKRIVRWDFSFLIPQELTHCGEPRQPMDKLLKERNASFLCRILMGDWVQ
jgi:hypothetical protein